jgi:hypothetical protein
VLRMDIGSAAEHRLVAGFSVGLTERGRVSEIYSDLQVWGIFVWCVIAVFLVVCA